MFLEKIPTYLHPPEGKSCVLAVSMGSGATQGFCGVEGRWTTMAIPARPAPGALGHIPERPLVIVPTGLQADWLNPGPIHKAESVHYWIPLSQPELVPREVGKTVGNACSNGPATC